MAQANDFFHLNILEQILVAQASVQTENLVTPEPNPDPDATPLGMADPLLMQIWTLLSRSRDKIARFQIEREELLGSRRTHFDSKNARRPFVSRCGRLEREIDKEAYWCGIVAGWWEAELSSRYTEACNKKCYPDENWHLWAQNPEEFEGTIEPITVLIPRPRYN